MSSISICPCCEGEGEVVKRGHGKLAPKFSVRCKKCGLQTDSFGSSLLCEICENEMVETVVAIKIKMGRKVKSVPVHCMRCTVCKSVRLTEEQVRELPEEVTMKDFLAYVALQDRVSTMGMQEKGLIKEELPKGETLIV